jgi:hypothetical protein
MLDINGKKIEQGGLVLLLCEVIAIELAGVRIRVMNSETDLYVGANHDEVLGGMIVDSELTAFAEADAPNRVQSEADGVAISRFE